MASPIDRLKVKREHFDHMAAVFANPTPCERMAHQPKPNLDEYVKAGMSHKRWRWDMTYWTGLTPWICNNIYPYANDDHIDSALRLITGTK